MSKSIPVFLVFLAQQRVATSGSTVGLHITYPMTDTEFNNSNGSESVHPIKVYASGRYRNCVTVTLTSWSKFCSNLIGWKRNML